MKSNIIKILSLLILAVASQSCVDDYLSSDGEFGDGEASIRCEAMFNGFDQTSLGGGTRTSGDTLNVIRTLDIFVFKNNGDFVGHYPIDNWVKSENHGRPDTLATTEDPTVRASFSFPERLPYGRYKMYAVANVPQSQLADVSTIDQLLGIQFNWNASHIDQNAQMLGFVTSDSGVGPDYESFSAPVIEIKQPAVTLYSWMRRVASKVTVAYDGRDLLENVYIYLKSVRVHNINKKAYLGKDSKATSAADVEDGEIEYYYDRKQYPQGPPQSAFGHEWSARVMKGTYNNGFRGSNHSNDANALFFFENKQGKGQSKHQDDDGDGVIDHPNGNTPGDDGYRDGKPYGTYIEVEAHYVSNVPGHMGNGKIIYRFMLGQNVDDNYDATRNCHYKVTLHFNKYANDVDWHIEYYQPTPSIDAPNPYYISYLYDKNIGTDETIGMPVQINGEIEPGSQIKTRILTNDWFPFGAPASVYYTDAAKVNQPWNGFLSLRSTGKTINISDAGATDNKTYYENKNRGWRNFSTTPGTYNKGTDATDGTYKVINNLDDKPGVTLLMPLYTRAKVLIKTTGYTGNNPYNAYFRKATVEVAASLKNPITNKFQQYKDTITIYQVRRTVNPKGIWRKYDSDESFHVVLSALSTQQPNILEESTSSFTPLSSEGPWYAEVIGSESSWVKLSPAGESYRSGDRIYGETGSRIEFNYKPANKLTDPNQVRCAMIRIRYHNFSCEHIIFVRQGYAPLAITSDGPEWYSFNMRTKTETAQSPVEEGNQFRWGRWESPINATNNRRSGYKFGENIGNKPLWIYPTNSGTGGTKWSDMAGNTSVSVWPDATIDGENARVATKDDWTSIHNKTNIQYGYGILYADGATTVQNPVVDAMGYYYDSPVGENKQTKGMRGIFVYNETTGAQVFFPIGAAGFGRRKGTGGWANTDAPGTLRYAVRSGEMPSPAVMDMPLFWKICDSPGAIYWCRNANSSVTGWDMNYWTYDFNTLATDGYKPGDASSSDAAFIRCVRDTKSSARKKIRPDSKRSKPTKLNRKFRK